MKNIFISYRERDAQNLLKIKKILNDNEKLVSDYTFSERPDSASMNKRKMKNEIKTRIETSDAIIFILGHEARDSSWLETEIKTVIAAEKPSVVIRIPNTRGHYPASLQGRNIPFVDLDAEQVHSKLNEIITPTN